MLEAYPPPIARGQRGRTSARAELVFTAVVILVVGFAWMIRIARADPEPDQDGWRYRRED